MSDIFERCEDIYKVVMVVAKRAKQIIDDRVVPIDENEDVEDSIEFEAPILDFEHEASGWFALKNLPSPMGPGLQNAVLKIEKTS